MLLNYVIRLYLCITIVCKWDQDLCQLLLHYCVQQKYFLLQLSATLKAWTQFDLVERHLLPVSDFFPNLSFQSKVKTNFQKSERKPELMRTFIHYCDANIRSREHQDKHLVELIIQSDAIKSVQKTTTQRDDVIERAPVKFLGISSVYTYRLTFYSCLVCMGWLNETSQMYCSNYVM